MTNYVSLANMRGGASEQSTTVPYISVYNGGTYKKFVYTCMWISLSQYLTHVLGRADATVPHLRDINGLRKPADNNSMFDTGIASMVAGMQRIAEEYDLSIHILLANNQVSRFNPNSGTYAPPIGRGTHHVYIVNFRFHYELVVYANSTRVRVDLRSRFAGFQHGGPGATAILVRGRDRPKITATSKPLTGRAPALKPVRKGAAAKKKGKQVPLSLREQRQMRQAVRASLRTAPSSAAAASVQQDPDLQRALAASSEEEQMRQAMAASRQSHQESVRRRDEALARDMQEAINRQTESEDAELARRLQNQLDQAGNGESETDSLEGIDDVPIEYVDIDSNNNDTEEGSGCVIS